MYYRSCHTEFRLFLRQQILLPTSLMTSCILILQDFVGSSLIGRLKILPWHDLVRCSIVKKRSNNDLNLIRLFNIHILDCFCDNRFYYQCPFYLKEKLSTCIEMFVELSTLLHMIVWSNNEGLHDIVTYFLANIRSQLAPRLLLQIS
jgi:hypothetical protein